MYVHTHTLMLMLLAKKNKCTLIMPCMAFMLILYNFSICSLPHTKEGGGEKLKITN